MWSWRHEPSQPTVSRVKGRHSRGCLPADWHRLPVAVAMAQFCFSHSEGLGVSMASADDCLTHPPRPPGTKQTGCSDYFNPNSLTLIMFFFLLDKWVFMVVTVFRNLACKLSIYWLPKSFLFRRLSGPWWVFCYDLFRSAEHFCWCF